MKELREKILDQQFYILEREDIPDKFKQDIVLAYREAWYYLSLAENLEKEIKNIQEIC